MSDARFENVVGWLCERSGTGGPWPTVIVPAL